MTKFFGDVLGNVLEIVRTKKCIINAVLYLRQYKPFIVFSCYTLMTMLWGFCNDVIAHRYHGVLTPFRHRDLYYY